MARATRVGGAGQARARAHQGMVAWFGRNGPGYLFILPLVVFLVLFVLVLTFMIATPVVDIVFGLSNVLCRAASGVSCFS